MVKKLIKKILGRGEENDNNLVGTLNQSTRIDWLKGTLKKAPSGGRILDAGAGEQPFKEFCAHLNYVSQDFALYNPEELKSGLHLGKWDYGKLDIISDITEIPEPDESFDAIMCTEVFEHIPNPREALKEFTRLLKKDGHLILTAPFCSLTHFAPYHFYTGFSKYFYEKELLANNFQIVEIQTNGNYFEYMAQETRRIPSMASKYADTKIGFLDKLALTRTLKMLARLSSKDRGSDELLCFGYHVLAKKK